MLAHGFQVINFLVALVLIAFALALFVVFARDKSRAITVVFVVACVGVSGFLLYLTLSRQ